jgi:hypothetical protein
MIIRPGGTSQFLITQPDHAGLARRIMDHWRGDGLADSPNRAAILLAVEEHDNGWAEVDVAPRIDAGGQILDFVNLPDADRRGVWPRGVERLAATPYAAALVAQHAVHVYRRYRGDEAWSAFFLMMEAARDRHLQRAPAATLDDLLRDYAFVRIGDLASLTFCNGWTEMQSDVSGHTVRLDNARLIISPDPFAGGMVKLEVEARELPTRAFGSTSDALGAYVAAPRTVLRGLAVGG